MVKNIQEMRADALEIFKASIAAVNPQNAVLNALSLEGSLLRVADATFDLSLFKKIVVVGGGKASAAMAVAVEEILAERISDGLVVVKYGHTADLQRVRTVEAAHPLPDDAGLKGTAEITSMLKGLGAEDLVISLISGGGSALLPQPVEGLSLDDKQRVTQVLLGCGATIHEINSIRKHLSSTKGGGMAASAYPATVINLMLSDVVGDDMDVIASGPFVPDSSSYSDALGIIDGYGVGDRMPVAVMDYLRGKAASGDGHDNGDIFAKVVNLIVGSNIIACQAAQNKARELGYGSLILSSMIEGDTTEIARAHCAIAREVVRSANPIESPACIISGGETTVVIKGKGLGGRNQEYALVCGQYLDGSEDNIVMLSGGTDGTDGPTDAAGGLADPYSAQRGRDQGMELGVYLADNDAYHYLEAAGDLIKTGPTLTNVMDIRLALIA